MKRYIILLVTMIATMACQKNNQAHDFDDSAMRFDVQHPATRATNSGFENGDTIGLYIVKYEGQKPAPLQISGNWANNVATTFNGTQWSPTKKIFWCDDKVDVYAYYPYMTPKSIDEHLFTVALDQSTARNGNTLGGYEASDFMWAKTAAADKSAQTVALAFSHRMSKITIKLKKGATYEGNFPDNSTAYIHNVVPTASIDFASGVASKHIYGEPKSIKCKKVDNSTFEAIIVPQRIESRRPLVEIVTGDISYLVEDLFAFKAGVNHTYTLTLNSNPEQIDVEIGGSTGGGWD